MKKLGVVVGIIGALMLGGCATNGGAETVATGAGEVPSEVAEAPAPTSTGPFEWDEYTDDELFIAMMETDWPEGRPDDASLIASAKQACEAIASGTDEDAVVVIEGDVQKNQRTVRAAEQVYCPEG